MKLFTILVPLFLSAETGWELLGKLTLHQQYDDLLGEMVEVPDFSEELKSYEGKIITIDGYVIPLQQTTGQDYFVLSRFPYNNCFFCGNAGPETVAEVYTSERFNFRDVRVRITGKLELNDDDPLHLFFIFKDAKVEVLD